MFGEKVNEMPKFVGGELVDTKALDDGVFILTCRPSRNGGASANETRPPRADWADTCREYPSAALGQRTLGLLRGHDRDGKPECLDAVGEVSA